MVSYKEKATIISKIHMRDVVFSLIFSVVVSTSFLIYILMSSTDSLESLLCLGFIPDNPRLAGYVLAILAYPVFFVCAYALFSRLFGHYDTLKNIKGWRKFSLDFKKKSIIRTQLVLLVVWIPAMIIIFPGTTTNVDTINQVYQFLTSSPVYYSTMGQVIDASFIDHHPWFDSVLYGSFVWLGIKIGSASLGFFFYTVFQALLASIVFGAAICYLSRLKTPYVIRFAILVIVGIAPMFSIEILTMQKDSLFGIFFLGYAMMYLDAIISKGMHLSNKKWLIVFAVLALMSILTKKTGLYVILVSGIVLLIAYRKEWRSLIAACGIPILIGAVCVPLVIFPMLNIAPGGKQEMFGPLYQQTITVLKLDPQAFSTEDKNQLNKILDVKKALKKYKAYKSDDVKRQERKNLQRSDYIDFIKIWFHGALKRPDLYIRSLLACSAELYIPSKHIGLNVEISQTGIAYFEDRSRKIGNPFELDAKNPELLNAVANKMKSFYNNVLCTYPPLSLFATAGWYDFVFPFLVFLTALVYRKKEILLGLTPVWLTSAVLIISPTSMSRYAVASIFLTVVLTGALAWCMHKMPKGRHVK